jgi:glutamyl-tRNA synthetase
LFDLAHVGRSPSRFDFAKLENLNGHYIRTAPDEELVTALETFAPTLPDGAKLKARIAARRAQVIAAMPGLKERAKTLIDLAEGARFILVDRPLDLDEKARALLTDDARAILRAALPAIEASDWNPQALDTAARALADKMSVKLSAVAQPLRAALTGRATSPGIFDVMQVLGRDESLARIRDQTGA